ncbi:MAG: RDD family protein [Bacteroidota bacterium]
MAEARDPRDRVTQTAFAIAPPLLGVELAAPWRRAMAFSFDLVLAVLAVEVGGPAVVGILAAVLFVLVATRRPAKTAPRRVGRAVLVGIGALILFGVVTGVVDDAQDDAREAASGPTAEAEPDEAPASEPEDRAATEAALQAYTAAYAAGDSLALDTLREAVVPLVAGAELDRLRRTRSRLGAAEDEAEALREAAENPGFLRQLWALAADFGVALTWLGVYAVLTLALWNGYTPGKRLWGIRVLRLDGQRVSLWTAFERFGGYAAGLVTGLLGFAQVLWDPNRQGVQDKIAATVVVRMADARTPRRIGPEAVRP